MSSYETDLRRARDHIDAADRKIIEALEERMRVVEKEIKPLKDENGEKTHDEDRVEEIMEKRVSASRLNPAFVKELFELIIEESERIQDQ